MSTQTGTGNVNYPPPPPRKDKSSEATKAAICGLVPGVGAVYNQDYMKAVVHLAAFSGLCIFAEANGIFGLLAFVFYIYTIFDAYRSAMNPKKKREFSADQINMPVWGVILILLGVVFLLDSLDAISIRSIVKFWPLGLVFLGCYMVFQYFISGKKQTETTPEASTVPVEAVPTAPVEAPAPTAAAVTVEAEGVPAESEAPEDPSVKDA